MAFKKKEDEDFNIVLYKNGDKTFELTNKGLYQIVSKFDADAPQGFQDFRTTKVLDPEVASMPVNLAAWDESRKMYDTGMTDYSAALSRLYPKPEERKIVLDKIQKFILKPMVERRGDVFDPRNLEFWDEEFFTLSLDHVFNTEKPEDLYALFLLVLHGTLAPSEFESDPYFRLKSFYSVENKEEVIDLKHKKELETNEAIGIFYTMLKNSKAELVALLEWMRISTAADTDDALLNSIFTRWLKDDSSQNPRAFIKAYDDLINSPSGKAELEMYSNLVTLRKAGKIKQAFNTITLNGEEIGSNLKDVNKKALADAELKEKLLLLLE